MSFDRWSADQLHCQDQDCEVWYGVDIAEPMFVRFRAYSEPVEDGPDFHLILLNARRDVLVRAPPSGRSPRRIETLLEPGEYSIGLVATGSSDGPLPFEITLSRVHRQRETSDHSGRANSNALAAPHSEFSIQLIEVAPDGTTVLLAAGTAAGVRTGLRGEFWERGISIGQFEIVEVSRGRSRALLLGPLRGPVSDQSTRATIHNLPD